MGIPPDIYACTNHCPRCFPLNESPDRVVLATGGIEKSPNFPGLIPPPPNGQCWLFPTPLQCEWYGHDSLFDWAVCGWYAFYSQVIIRVVGGADAFVHTPSTICERYFTNAHQNPAIFGYNFGNAVVIAVSEIVNVIETHIAYFEDGAFFEVHPGTGRTVTIRYANRIHRQNILIKFDIDEIL